MSLLPKRRQPAADPDDSLRLQLAEGDVAEIFPAELTTTRSLDADKGAVTAMVEQLAATGSIDRATGGHLLDEEITSWHDQHVAAIQRLYLGREAASDTLIGKAESRHVETLENLGAAAERYRRHATVSAHARRQLLGNLVAVELPHHELIAQAEQRVASHEKTCVTSYPRPWAAPWRDTSIEERLRGLDL